MTTFGACPTGSHLSQYGGPLQFNCVKDCTSDADCRDRGYACVDSDYDGSRECAPFAQGDLALGEACTGYWECAGGNHIGCAVSAFGGPDGKFCTAWCNPARNREQGECPDRMLCMSGRCFPSEEICFTGDGLCPVNKYCTVDEDADCAGINAEVGEPCEETADCGLSVDVYCSDEADGFPDGYCMVQGGVIVDCPDGSDFNNDFIHGNSLLSQCWLECDADSDCRGPDYECYAPYFRGSNVCAPAGTGTRAVGSPCSSTADCAGGQYHLCLDGYCAQLCDLTAAESGCPAGTRCGAADFVCRAECDDTSECPAGFDCVARMCLPQRE
ncbi:MAG: hypothetical protein H6697_11865, partial [Myxococcales bacterium]|nr:hypothetical protein [Myxococcales bacterium]